MKISSMWICLCLLASWLGTTTVANAQQARGHASAQARDKRDKPARKSKRARAAERAAERKRAQAAVPEAPPPSAPKAEQALPATAAQPDPKPAAEGPAGPAGKDAPQRPAQPTTTELDAADVHKEGDTEVKVMEFSGLDIEGQLKTPQMLYFLNRLRAEFGRPRLPHRSFMPELQQGTQDKAMR